MSGKTKLIGALEGVVIALGLYSVFMSVMVVLIRMMNAGLWDEAPSPTLASALPKSILFLVLATGAVVALERMRRATNEPKPRRIAWLGLMSAGVVAGIAAGHLVWSTLGLSALKREIAALEKDGLAPQWPAGKTVPEAENAVTLLLQAATEFTKTAGPNFSGSEPQKALTAYLDRFNQSGVVGPERSTVVALLASNQAAVVLAGQAADRKSADWNDEVVPPFVMSPIPEFLPYQQIGKLLAVQAIERATAGDTAGAAQSIRTGLAMSDAVGASPLVIAQMIRSAVHSSMLDTAKRIFDTPEELAIAEPLWAPYLNAERMLEETKTAMRLDLMGVPREMASRVLPSPADSFPSAGAPIEKLMSSPIYYFGIAATLHDQRPLFESVGPGKPGAPTLPALAPRYVSRAAIGAARIEVARAALEWSKTPGDLAKGVGTDPFGGAPLRAIASSGGTLIFSIGPDRKDDGGAAYDKGKDTGDLSWLIRSGTTPASVSVKSPGK